MKKLTVSLITVISAAALFLGGLLLGNLLRDDDPGDTGPETVSVDVAIPADPDAEPDSNVEVRLPRPSARQFPSHLVEPTDPEPDAQPTQEPYRPPTVPGGLDDDDTGTPDPDLPYVVADGVVEYTAEDVFGAPDDEPPSGDPLGREAGDEDPVGGEPTDPVFADPCADVPEADADAAAEHCPGGVGGTILLIDEGAPPRPLTIMKQFYTSISVPMELRCPDLGTSADGIYRPLFASNNPADFTIRYWQSVKPESVREVTYRSSEAEMDRWIERRLAGEDTWGDPRTGVHNCPELPLPDDMPHEAHFTIEIDGVDDQGSTASVRLYATIESAESQLGRPPMAFGSMGGSLGIVGLPYDPDEEMAYLAAIPKTGSNASSQTCTDIEPLVLDGRHSDAALRRLGTGGIARGPGDPAYDSRFSLSATAELRGEEGTTYLLCGWAATPAKRSFDLPNVTHRDSLTVRAPRHLRVRVSVSGGRTDIDLAARSVRLRPVNWGWTSGGSIPEAPVTAGPFRFGAPVTVFDSGYTKVPEATVIEVTGPHGATQLLEVPTPTRCVDADRTSRCPRPGVDRYDIGIPEQPGRGSCSGGLFGSCEPAPDAFVGNLQVLVERYAGPGGAPAGGAVDGWQVTQSGSFAGRRGERPATPQIDTNASFLREYRQRPDARPGLAAQLEFDRPVRIVEVTPWAEYTTPCVEPETFTVDDYRTVHFFRWDELCYGTPYTLSVLAVDVDGNSFDWRPIVDGVPTAHPGWGYAVLSTFPILEYTVDVDIDRIGDGIGSNDLQLSIAGAEIGRSVSAGGSMRCVDPGSPAESYSRRIRNAAGYPPKWGDMVRVRLEVNATGDGRFCGRDQWHVRVQMSAEISLTELLSSPEHTFVYDEDDARITLTIRDIRPGAAFTPLGSGD